MRLVHSPRLLIGVGCVLAGLVGYAADRSPGSMADAANTFLSTLTPEQKQMAAFPFESAEREHWGFTPSEIFKRTGGVTLGAMTEPQRQAAHGEPAATCRSAVRSGSPAMGAAAGCRRRL